MVAIQPRNVSEMNENKNREMNVFFVPCSGDIARTNFRNTVSKPKSLESLKQCGSSEKALSVLASTGRTSFSVWGFGSGPKNTGFYNRLEKGDIVVFSRRVGDENFIYACGTVVCKEVNEKLSEHIWNLDGDHSSFRNLFYMEDCFDELHVRLEPADLGYDSGYHFGTSVCYGVGNEKRNIILERVNAALMDGSGRKVC